MVEFARGSRFLLNTPPRAKPNSPYGDSLKWDMLWLGHCDILEQRNDGRRWIITDDSIVAPSEFHKNNVDNPTLSPFGNEHTVWSSNPPTDAASQRTPFLYPELENP